MTSQVQQLIFDDNGNSSSSRRRHRLALAQSSGGISQQSCTDLAAAVVVPASQVCWFILSVGVCQEVEIGSRSEWACEDLGSSMDGSNSFLYTVTDTPAHFPLIPHLVSHITHNPSPPSPPPHTQSEGQHVVLCHHCRGPATDHLPDTGHPDPDQQQPLPAYSHPHPHPKQYSYWGSFHRHRCGHRRGCSRRRRRPFRRCNGILCRKAPPSE